MRYVLFVPLANVQYSRNVVEAARSLKYTVQMKRDCSSWHDQYRTMDDLCLSVRLFRSFGNELQPDIEKSSVEFPEILENAEESVINELTEILLEELRKGLDKEKVGKVFRTGGDAIGIAPVSRKNHFEYGVLDLIQQQIQPLDSGKINYKVMEICLQVAEVSPYSYLRCKAFEILAAMSSKPGIGQVPVYRVNDLLAKETWPFQAREKVGMQWRIMRKRAVDVDYYLMDLRNKSPSLMPLSSATFQVCSGSPPV